MSHRGEWQAAGLLLATGLVLLLTTTTAKAYPGGTPGFQTDAAPFCASCHSSRSVEMLAGAPGDRATKELAENKHLALILAGEGGYGQLSAEQRNELADHVRALDAASTVTVKAPAKVAPGESFRVTVDVTGGAGPAVGIALVDTAHRWLARPAPGVGWSVVQPPTILGQDFQEQADWLARRPEPLARNLSFVNVTGLRSDAAAGDWARAQVVWTLRAPPEAGSYPLAAAYWYGTEKASPLGIVEDPIRGKLIRGGFAGHSGRILFSEVQRIQVQP
jgi:cytochrome c553